MINMNRIILLIFMVIFIVIVGTFGYPIERWSQSPISVDSKIEDGLEDGKCWCCSCGWQSCKVCAANAGKCCPQAMGFERWSFGKGAVGTPIVEKQEEGKKSDSSGKTYDQRQALLAALEKAGFQPHSMSMDDLNALIAKAIREDDYGGELVGNCK